MREQNDQRTVLKVDLEKEERTSLGRRTKDIRA